MIKIVTFLKVPTATITIYPHPNEDGRIDLTNMDYVVKKNCTVIEIPIINGKMYSEMFHKDVLDREDLEAVHKSRENRKELTDKKRRESFWLTKA